MALLSAPEVVIAIAIGIAKTLIARSCVMLFEELNATAIGNSQSAIALEWRSNTTKKTVFFLQELCRSKRLGSVAIAERWRSAIAVVGALCCFV